MENDHQNQRGKKQESLTRKSIEHFELIQREDSSKKLYKCLLCTQDAKPINGTKTNNLSQHLKNVHSEFYYQNIQTIKHIKEPLQIKRLRLLQNAVEIVTVNGRPFNSLLDSGYQAGIQNKLHKLQKSGIGLSFNNNMIEIKEHLSKMAANCRIKIRNELRGKTLALMADICTKNNRSMFGVSAQFICSGKVQIRSLGLFELDQAHTGEYLANVLCDILAKYGIEKWQVICMTTDNGKNMKKMVRDFNEISKSPTVNDSTNTNSPNAVESRTIDEDIDDEIQQILAQANDMTDDDALDIIFYQNQLEQNSNVLSSLTLEFVGSDMIWDTTDINCIVHTLQLATKDSCESLSHCHKNVIGLAREVAKFLRNPSNRREMERQQYKLPRLECATRWCSLCIMVSIVKIVTELMINISSKC